MTLADHTVPTITRAADEFGRPAPRVIAALPVCVTGDKAGASARAAEAFAGYGGLPSYRAMLDREGVAGPADIAIIGIAGEVQDRRRRPRPGSVSPISRRWNSGYTASARHRAALTRSAEPMICAIIIVKPRWFGGRG